MADFTAQVFQNEYLPAGGDTVDAVITVNSAQGTETGSSQGLPLSPVGLACDVSNLSHSRSVVARLISTLTMWGGVAVRSIISPLRSTQ